MNINQSTLTEFEKERSDRKWIPPLGSNSFYTVGDGEINLLTLKSHPENFRFNILTNRGSIHTGPGTFYLSGNVYDNDHPYDSMTVIQNTSLSIDDHIDISKGKLEVHGVLELLPGSVMIISHEAEVILYPDSTLIIHDGASVQITWSNSTMNVYGKIECSVNTVDLVLNKKGVVLDSAAILEVSGIDTTGRPTTMTDYERILRNRIININTQGDTSTVIGRMGYSWRGGTPLNRSQILQLHTLNGDTILGDFKLSVLGLPEHDVTGLQMISELIVKKNTSLFITETYHDFRFVRPNLFIGILLSNSSRAGRCIIEGSCVVSGENASITLDRGGSIYVEEGATLHLIDHSMIHVPYNDNSRILFINGTMYIDTIDQISELNASNIYFGDRGKLIIRNPSPEEKTVMFSIPNGIHDSDLYRLFEDRLDHIEYHIAPNYGISIDQYYEYYSRDLKDWYGGVRIEKAIHNGWIVWHDGAFIQLKDDIIPWVNQYSSLLDASKIFKTTESEDRDRLQDVVNRLRYAGCGNVVFVFVHGSTSHECTMDLSNVDITSVYNYPLTDTYRVTTDSDAQVFIRNNTPDTEPSTIINPKSKMIHTDNKVAIFSVE